MIFQEIRDYCVSLKGAEEDVKWECDLTFLIGRKMFAVIGIRDEEPQRLCFKVGKDDYETLIQMDGIEPAPYLARYQWVSIEKPETFPDEWMRSMLDQSYALIFAKLPKRVRAEIG